MDDYDFREIDKYYESQLNSILTMPIKPSQFELIPIGEYDGDELSANCQILDDSYIVYMEVANPELT